MTERTDAASYIAMMTRELAVMAKRHRLADLAKLLEMAALQAATDMNPQG